MVSAAERELAASGRYYQCGGLIVSIATDPTTGDPSIVPTNVPALTRELSVIAAWEKFDGRSHSWTRCDPPPRHVGILYDAQNFRHLPPLVGVARQPYLSRRGWRTRDRGRLRLRPQDALVSLMYDQYVVPEPTEQAARTAVAKLEGLLRRISLRGSRR